MLSCYVSRDYFKINMGWIFAVLFHSAFLYTVTTRLHVGLGAGAAPVQDPSQFGHGLKDALGHGHIATRGCCRVESSEPRTTKMLPFGLRKMLQSEIICC